MTPKVSVIIPVYNCELYISECLESILNQTYTNIEVILINDGSPDSSEEIILNYKRRDSRIIYEYQKNKGPSEARNRGIALATGDFLTFIDSDDKVEKNYIKRLLGTMIDSDADLVCCGYKDTSVYGLVKHTDFKFKGDISLREFINMVCTGTGGVLWAKMYKTDIIRQNGLRLNHNIFMSEDLIFVLQYVTYCRKFKAIEEYLYNYNRLNQGSISANMSVEYLQNHILVCKEITKVLQSVNFDKGEVKQIISKRIQMITWYLIEQQSINVQRVGLVETSSNIKEIISNPYVEKYGCPFLSASYLYKPYAFFLNKKYVKVVIIYGYLLGLLKKIKRKL